MSTYKLILTKKRSANDIETLEDLVLMIIFQCVNCRFDLRVQSCVKVSIVFSYEFLYLSVHSADCSVFSLIQCYKLTSA